MIEQPVVGEGSDPGWLQALLGDGLDVTLDPGESGVRPVAHPGLDQVAESLDWIKFRAKRRKGQKP